MVWLKLFALLVATAITNDLVSAEGPKKKIRIHVPQNVKHIHHHKKIYITNHPASSQYAPAYMPSAKGAVAVPTNIALPAVAKIVSLNSAEIYEDSQTRPPGALFPASKLLPLYHARGYYGPNPKDFEDQEFDLVPPRETLDALPASVPIKHPPKKVKIVKINETPRTRFVRKNKPKHVVVRGRPQLEEEHPVSSFHEQFYSDVAGSGTIRKIKRPPRTEKIIDGDTEHIHTYTEEHIHKLYDVYNDGQKSSSIHSVGGISPLPSQHALVPIRHPHTLLAFSPDALTGYTAVGSMGTPSHLEYAGYNARDVTHDHIYHDHGEIPPELDIPSPNTPSFFQNNQGIRIGGTKKVKNKYLHRHAKSTETPPTDLSQFENMYPSLYNVKKPKEQPTSPDSSFEDVINNFRPVPDFNFNFKKRAKKPKNTLPTFDFYSENQVSDYLTSQTGIPAPFSVSSALHNYKPKKPLAGRGSPRFSKYKDPLLNFKDSSYTSNFEFDTSASSSNIVMSENKNIYAPFTLLTKKGKKNPSQNIKFDNSDHQTLVNPWEDMDITPSQNDGSPSGFDYNHFEETHVLGSGTPTPYTIKVSSSDHPYYSAMTIKALHSENPPVQASNDNFQYVEAPTPATTSPFLSLATTTETPQQSDIDATDLLETEQPKYQVAEIRQQTHNKELNSAVAPINRPRKRFRLVQSTLSNINNEEESGAILNKPRNTVSYTLQPTVTTGKLKYGDKI